MRNDSHIALLLFTWASTGLTTFTALDATTRLPGGSTIAKHRNWRIACAVIPDIGLWSGLWLGQLGLHRQVGAAVSAPIMATLMAALVASLAASSIMLPGISASSDTSVPQRRSIAMGAVALGIGLLTVKLCLTHPWVHDQALSLHRAVLGQSDDTLVLDTGVCLTVCVTSHMPPTQRRAAVGLRTRATAVLATAAVLSLALWPCAAAWPVDESAIHIVPIIVLSADDVLIALGLHTVPMMLETCIGSAQAHLETSLARVTNQTPRPQLHDALTGLPNHLHLREVLEATALSSTQRGRPFALFYLGPGNFGQINDQYGRNVGDRTLQVIAERLRQAIRGEDIMAHLSDDEFDILIEGLALPEAAATIDDKLLFRLRESVGVEGWRLRATASIGVIAHSRNGATADTLLERADTAMFGCKQSTDNAYRFFEPRLNTTIHRVLQIQRAPLHTALNGQLSMYYQPKYNAYTRAMAGAEALLRWNHPELDPVSPAEFILLTERTGTIAELGNWVVEEVCRQIMHWNAIGMAPQRIVISLSSRQFQQPDLIQHLSQILHRYQVTAHRLVFEITETTAVRDASQSIAAIRQIQSLGSEVAVDDFGTSYSGLGYLQRFRAQQIKIDRAFVSAFDDSPPEAAAITHATCAMAYSLSMTVAAGGVETEARMQALMNLQYDQVQGYLLARPMPAKDPQGLLGIEYA